MKVMTDLIPKVEGKYDPSAWARTKVGEPGFLPSTKSPPVERGSGWVKPLDHSVHRADFVTSIRAMDVQDALDRRELEKRLRRRVMARFRSVGAIVIGAVKYRAGMVFADTPGAMQAGDVHWPPYPPGLTKDNVGPNLVPLDAAAQGIMAASRFAGGSDGASSIG